MTVSIHNNTSATIAQRYFNHATSKLNTSIVGLASGNKINSAQDDAAGLQISNRLNVQNRGLHVAVRNAHDGISIAQTADDAMDDMTSVLQTMRDLSLQSANGSNSKDEREAIQQDVTALNDELNYIAETTTFGGKNILNGTFGSKAFQIGSDSGEALTLNLQNMRSDNLLSGGVFFRASEGKDSDWALSHDASLTISVDDASDSDDDVHLMLKAGDNIEQIATRINGQKSLVNTSVDEQGRLQIYNDSRHQISLSGDFPAELGALQEKYETVADIDVTTAGGAQRGVAIVDTALKYLDSQRAELGTFQNRLSHAINNLDSINENVYESKSQIKDTDFAKQTTAMTKSQILQQSSTSILAQAKQSTNTAISLLG